MVVLILGLILFTGIHFIPTLAPQVKEKWTRTLGIKRYAGLFALMVFLSIGVMILGWRSITPTQLYYFPPVVQSLASLLVLAAFILFVSASNPTRLKRFIRHPQLTGVACWATAHLIINGDSRGVLLFGWIGLWAIIQMSLINRRDGAWVKQEAPAPKMEARVVAKALVGITIFALAHPLFTGRHAIPYLEGMFRATLAG